jgi:hypothetical protein
MLWRDKLWNINPEHYLYYDTSKSKNANDVEQRDGRRGGVNDDVYLLISDGKASVQ